MKLKIAIVSPIFSDKISGGSEKHAFHFANLLKEKYEVSILTTQALNYQTWKNEFHPELNLGFKIHRFKNKSTRSISQFNKLHSKLIQKKSAITEKEMNEWIVAQGPNSPDLINFIVENSANYDVFLFMTYLYYPTIYGIENVKNKSILVPTLHDEASAYFPIFKKIFTNELTYSFNTIEEYLLFKKIFSYAPKKFSIVGMNIEPVKNFEAKKIDFDFILYIGRIDSGKGIDTLIEFFLNWKTKFGSELKLVFIGGGKIKNSEHLKNTSLRFTGFISEEEKLNYIQQCTLFLNPSSVESFSISIMEAWMQEKAILVNAESDVMKEHCNRSNGGLYYSDSESFALSLNYLLDNPQKRSAMGKNGFAYVQKNYTKERVQEKLFQLVESVASTKIIL